MTIEWFRDLVIIIFGLGAVIALLGLALVAFLCYRRMKPILESLRESIKTVENISKCVEVEVARPLAQVAAFVQGIRQAVNMVNRLTKKKEED